MKNKIAIASAFLAAASFSTAEIVVNDFLSFEGFVDSSYSHTDAEAEGTKESDNSFGIDQVEISWLFDFDAVTAQIDIEYEGSSRAVSVYDPTDDESNDGELDSVIVEQAFVNYALGNGDVITAGRYASMLGFEAFEPTGLYQYSTAYDISGFDFDVNSNYVQGVKYTRTSDTTFFGISVQDQAFGTDGDRLGGDDNGTYGVEVAGSMDLGNGFTVFAGATFESADEDTELYNAYVTYETGAWLFAAEINIAEGEQAVGADIELMSGLLMANYAYSDVASVTARISAIEVEIGNNDLDITKYTVAHNYALSDNLLLVTEISLADGELDLTDDDNDNSFDGDSLTAAVELLFSF
tara:strand:+ start:534 stop:1592 length:1059 start_codon:yes stop_codon:yes gene_type:complete